MKKQTLFISLFLLSTFLTHAAVININSGTADALRLALSSAATGDVIEMAAGTYVESNSSYLAFTSKEVTVRAAEGAVVLIQPQVPITLSEGATARFENIKFDVSRLTELDTKYEHLIYPSDANEDNKLFLEGCEFYGFNLNKSMIYCSSSKRLSAVTINNCYFHNIMKSILFVENTADMNVQIKNSTFANISTDASSYYAGVIDVRATSGSVLVDHCTFYNVHVMNTAYAAVGKINMTTGAVVSNCIFAMPESTSDVRTIRDAVTANNCLVFNYTSDSNFGMQSNVTKNNCIIGDPLFTDAANGDFSFAGNWSTGSYSPARGAATDGSDLGDPRWYTEEILPSTDFATDYDLLGTKALLRGNIALEDSKIKYSGSGTPGSAKWKLHVDRVCAINAVVDRTAGNNSGCELTLTAYDADGNEVDAVAASSTSYNDNDIILPGSIYIPQAGDYTFILSNSTDNSGSLLEKITLSYAGCAVQNISSSANTILNVADAWFSSTCARDADGITYPSSGTADAWIKWNISTTETKFYDVTVNINTTQAHGFTVAVYEDVEASPVASVTEGTFVQTTGSTLALELGRINLVGGKNYVVKVTNATSGSQAEVLNVTFAPVAASATELPNTLAFSDAVLSARAHITDGKLYFAPIGDTNPVGDWARWAVTTDHDGLFLFTMNVNSDNGQSYKISIYNDSEELVDLYEAKPSSGAQTLKHYFPLATGNYSVKVENTTSWSHGHLISLVVTEPDNVLTIDETATDNSVIAAALAAGVERDIQILRTLKGGVYNTICLPFVVSSEMTKEIFGADVKLFTLGQATVEDEGYAINLEFNPASDIYPGTPLLIKPAKDIVNPVFIGVTVSTATASSTTKTNANFVGTFIKQTVPADVNNLFLGSDDKLYFSRSDMPIKGMRAWFSIHDTAPGLVQRARIVESGNVVTEVELLCPAGEAECKKVIEDGQIFIIRDGRYYNVMGQTIK